MSVEEAIPFFANNRKITAMLDALTEVQKGARSYLRERRKKRLKAAQP